MLPILAFKPCYYHLFMSQVTIKFRVRNALFLLVYFHWVKTDSLKGFICILDHCVLFWSSPVPLPLFYTITISYLSLLITLHWPGASVKYVGFWRTWNRNFISASSLALYFPSVFHTSSRHSCMMVKNVTGKCKVPFAALASLIKWPLGVSVSPRLLCRLPQ